MLLNFHSSVSGLSIIVNVVQSEGANDSLAIDGLEGDDNINASVWNPGDDNDTLEGEADIDTMLFNGANIAENIDSLSFGEALPTHLSSGFSR
jgi:hypothetical protein